MLAGGSTHSKNMIWDLRNRENHPKYPKKAEFSPHLESARTIWESYGVNHPNDPICLTETTMNFQRFSNNNVQHMYNGWKWERNQHLHDHWYVTLAYRVTHELHMVLQQARFRCSTLGQSKPPISWICAFPGFPKKVVVQSSPFRKSPVGLWIGIPQSSSTQQIQDGWFSQISPLKPPFISI